MKVSRHANGGGGQAAGGSNARLQSNGGHASRVSTSIHPGIKQNVAPISRSHSYRDRGDNEKDRLRIRELKSNSSNRRGTTNERNGTTEYYEGKQTQGHHASGHGKSNMHKYDGHQGQSHRTLDYNGQRGYAHREDRNRDKRGNDYQV